MDTLCAALSSSMKSPSIEIRSRHTSSPRSSSNYEMDSPTSSTCSGPRCWDEQLQDISEGLQLICGSPSPMFSPKSPAPSSGSPNFPSLPNFLANEPLSPISPFVRQEMRRATSVTNPTTNPSRRPMTVRHIETSRQLTQQLSIICGIKAGQLNAEEDAEDEEWSRAQRDAVPDGGASSESQETSSSVASAPLPPVSYRAAALMAAGAKLRLKVDVRSTMLEDLIVSVGERNILTVRTTHGFNKVLLRSILPASVEINRLLCYVHGPMLLIHERPENRSEFAFVGIDSTYLPIVRENEIRKELTIVLHAPDAFEFKDLNVRTVDDTVIFTGVREGPSSASSSSSLLLKSAVFSFDPAAADSSAVLPPPSFQVTIPLPNGVDSRSVTACLAKHNQVIVKGRLCPGSRSCTM